MPDHEKNILLMLLNLQCAQMKVALTNLIYKNLVLSTELIMLIGHRTEILKADVSSVSPSSERIEFCKTLMKVLKLN